MSEGSELNEWASGAALHVRRRVRLLMLLDAADYTGISPITTSRLHAFAFLADVLSPIYDLTAVTGRILKKRAGPYYPDLQWELDRLIGLGLVEVTELKACPQGPGASIDAAFSLRRVSAAPILLSVHENGDFSELRDYMREVAGALGSIEDDDLDSATRADVTWESGHNGSVIDYAEWRAKNFSDASAEKIAELARDRFGPQGIRLSAGAKVHLYVQYLRRAADG